MPVMTAKKFKRRNMRESRRTACGGSGSRDGCRSIGTTDAMEVSRGMRALRRR